MRRTNYVLMGLASCAVLLVSVPSRTVFAYSADAETPAATSTPAAAEGLEEIVVTAQKESQNLQKAAAAITVVGHDTLIDAGVTDLAGLQDLIPAVRFQQESASTEVYIRGVGSTLDFPMVEPPTAFNINGIYIPREISSTSLFDMKGIEVLPGPQGTLYGRGALGGAVDATMVRPGDGTGNVVLLEGGNYSLVHAMIAGDIKLNEMIDVRAAVNGLYHDGYEVSGAESAKDLGGRFSTIIRPTDNLSIYLWTQIEHKEGNAENVTAKGSFTDPKSQSFTHPGNGFDDTLTGSLAGFVYPGFGPISAYPSDWRAQLYGGELDWQFGNSTITYIPSYVDLNWHQGYWLTEKPSVFNENIGQWTHELRWSGTSGPLKWLAGLYAYRLHTDGTLFIDFPPNGLGAGLPSLWLDASDVRSHTLQGEATFGQLTWSFTDLTRLVVGGRVATDHRTAWGYVPTVVAGPSPGVAPAVAGPIANPLTCLFGTCETFSGDKRWTSADWKIGLERDLSVHSMVYVTSQTAFQPGTFDTFPNTVTEPSKLLSFALGSKNTFLDGRIRLNDEAFYYKYKDLLVQAFDAATGQQRLHTAQNTLIYGDQLDFSFLIDPSTTFSSSVGYTHARFQDFSFPSSTGQEQVYDGNQLQNAPDWTVSLSLDHFFALPGGAAVEARAGTRFESGFWGDFAHTPGLYQANYTKSDATLTFHPATGSWRLAAWVKNIEGKAIQGAAAAAGALDPGPGSFIPEPPRTFGLRFTSSW
jgi:iron complex outermembrane recepter protein